MKQSILPKYKSKDYRPVFEVGDTNAGPAENTSNRPDHSRVNSTSPRAPESISHRNYANGSPKSQQPGTQRHRSNATTELPSKANANSQTPLADRNIRIEQSLTKSAHNASIKSRVQHVQPQNLNLTTSSMHSKTGKQTSSMPLAYRSINKFNQTVRSNSSRVIEAAAHPKDPELVCTEKVLPESIEEEIKDGFFELKQKFKDAGPSSIYISHVVLHEKHPILKKIEVETLKTLLLESSVIYLSVGQTLYRYGVHDSFVYIILFGKLSLQVPSNPQTVT